MVDEALVFASATALLELISTGQVSPVELTELYLSRIDRLDPQLNSFLLLNRDEALQTAKVAEDAVAHGDALGPLHGLPIPIKDTQMTKGLRTTAGSLLFKERIPDRDAAIVERVRAAGAIILGKTNIPEFAMVGTCENRLGEPGRNPWIIFRLDILFERWYHATGMKKPAFCVFGTVAAGVYGSDDPVPDTRIPGRTGRYRRGVIN